MSVCCNVITIYYAPVGQAWLHNWATHGQNGHDKAISNNNIQNIKLIRPLGSATGKRFTYSASSPTTRPKRELFLQMSLQERGCPYLGCASQVTKKKVSRIGTLLDANFRSLITYFRFKYQYRFLVGDTLVTTIAHSCSLTDRARHPGLTAHSGCTVQT